MSACSTGSQSCWRRTSRRFRVFSYLTLRAILAMASALCVSLLLGPGMIARLSRYQIGQVVREDGPRSHLPKAGTPTMGGVLILVAILISTLLWADLRNRFIWITIAVMVGLRRHRLL